MKDRQRRQIFTPGRLLTVVLVFGWALAIAVTWRTGVWSTGVVTGAEAVMFTALLVVTSAAVAACYIVESTRRHEVRAREDLRFEIHAAIMMERHGAVEEITKRVIRHTDTMVLPVLHSLSRGLPTTYVTRPTAFSAMEWDLRADLTERTGDIKRPG